MAVPWMIVLVYQSWCIASGRAISPPGTVTDFPSRSGTGWFRWSSWRPRWASRLSSAHWGHAVATSILATWPVPVFAAGDLSRLERACAGHAFAERRDAALIAVFRATGIRLSELAGIRYDSDDPGRSDVDLWHREITVQGKGRKTRVVKISFDAARRLDRYIRVRARHAQAYRPQLWPGAGNLGPMTASGIYQALVRRGRQCGIDVFPHRFRHHFSHTWLDHGGAEGDLMELNSWTSPQMLRRYGASARSARARRSYDRVMEEHPDRGRPGIALADEPTSPPLPARNYRSQR
jgi:integrase